MEEKAGEQLEETKCIQCGNLNPQTSDACQALCCNVSDEYLKSLSQQKVAFLLKGIPVSKTMKQQRLDELIVITTASAKNYDKIKPDKLIKSENTKNPSDELVHGVISEGAPIWT